MKKNDRKNIRIAVIGAGHIGLALIEGLLRGRQISASKIILSSPAFGKIKKLKKFNISVTSDNELAAAKSDIVFLAVKPALVRKVILEMREALKGKVVVSLAAGIPLAKLQTIGKGSGARFLRIMPNMSISCGQGVIGLFAKGLQAKEKSKLKNLLETLGFCIEVKNENDLDVLTVISGSGPAIASYFIETLAASAQKLGLSRNSADAIAHKTFHGTLEYIDEYEISPQELMRSVATKGGVTEAILAKLNKEKINDKVLAGLKEGHAKIKKIRNT
jgi:pyrroline-5-carboxylate reductase